MKYIKTPDGTIAANDKGYPLSEVPHGYDVQKFDFDKLYMVCCLADLDCGNEWSIFDVGYWDSEGKYHKPCNRPSSYRN